MTTVETADPIMAAFVQRYAATRANAANVASAARAINVQISALCGDATGVSDNDHLLKVEFRTSLQSLVGAFGRDKALIDGADAVVRAVTGYEDMLGDLYMLKSTCDELIDAVEQTRGVPLELSEIGTNWEPEATDDD
jgi:hypothetical protein